MRKIVTAVVAILAMSPDCGRAGERQTLSLDGMWQVSEGVSPTNPPAGYRHRVPVPALTHSASPGFPAIDEFRTPEYEVVRGLLGLSPEKTSFEGPAGTAAHKRQYFWYRTSFNAPAARANARMTVGKAQFGSEVWINGTRVGSNQSGFTSASYDISKAIRWAGKNEVVIRVGANPNVLPEGNTAIFDFEKVKWTPGIWDNVSVYFSDGINITSTQIAPRIKPAQIQVQTILKNTTSGSVTFELAQSVRSPKGVQVLAQRSQPITLAAGEERMVNETIPLPSAKLWSPESPNLYVLDTSTGSDSTTTRFGMREFRFDSSTKRAYLNGKQIFLRGGNIALHRFFDDENAGTLPWQDAWVRKLLGPIPRKMNWNTVKFTIGPVPQRWLDIADEEGLLVLYEFPLWTLDPSFTKGYTKTLDMPSLRREYAAWLSDNWNHPSIVYWAASLESKLPEEQTGKIIEQMRKLDLSNRPWGNSWNPPQGPDDPHEYKQYISNDPNFEMTQLEAGSGIRRAPYDPPTGHAGIITEFDWLWLDREGNPTPYTQELWKKLAKPGARAEDRFKTQAYLLAGQIEYWRAHRNYAGVIYLAYLSKGWVMDNFADVKNLTFHPYFEEYVSNAYKPLGVYLNFWRPSLQANGERSFSVMMVNDKDAVSHGTLSLLLEDREGHVVARMSRPYEVAPLGQMTYPMSLALPVIEGDMTLKAVATPAGDAAAEATISRRFVKVIPKGASPRPQAAPGSPPNIESGGQFDVEK